MRSLLARIFLFSISAIILLQATVLVSSVAASDHTFDSLSGHDKVEKGVCHFSAVNDRISHSNLLFFESKVETEDTEDSAVDIDDQLAIVNLYFTNYLSRKTWPFTCRFKVDHRYSDQQLFVLHQSFLI